MAEVEPTTTTDGGTTDNGTTQPTTTTEEPKPFDISSLPKEAWTEIFKHERFSKLNEKAKLADQLQKEKNDAEQAALEEQGKWKEIADKTKSEVEQWKSNAITAEIKAFAAKAGAFDLSDVAALADKAEVAIDENGVITGAEEAVKKLLEAKPHLFNSNNKPQPRVGNGTNPGDANNQGIPKFTHSQIKDPTFWKEHEQEILAALKAGTVTNDLQR